MSVEIAYAKLTTHLHMTGVRDDGYHLIDAEMVSLDLADELHFVPGDGLTIDGPSFLSAGPGNLISKALAAAGRTAQVHLIKRIPVGGGLGGGSTDAAAALRWAGRAETPLAAQIGADVPFCLRGGRARVRGIGDEVDQVAFEARDYTLLLPPFGVSTAAVYRKFDEIGIDEGAINHLEAPAIAVEPRLAEWRDKLASWTGEVPVLAGSGSTWFVNGKHEAPPQPELGGARWIVTKTVPAVGTAS